MEKGREKRKSTLSISSRVSHSKNFEAKQHESTRGNTRPRQFPSLNSRELRGEQSIRQISGSTARSGRANTRGRISLLRSREEASSRKSFGNAVNCPSMHIHYATITRGHLPSTRHTCVYDYAPAPFIHSLLSPPSLLVRVSGISGCRASMRVTWTRMQPAHRLCKRCAPTVIPGPALYSRVRNLLINYRPAVTPHRSCIIIRRTERSRASLTN